MTQAEVANHTETSERFLRHAEDEFERGDLPQASEKAWGAVAHYIKSVAKQRRWRNRSHSDLSDIVVDLAQETDDPAAVKRLYGSMNGLHANFYEDWYTDQMVAQGIDDARELISRLGNRMKPPVEPRPSQAGRRKR
ncbi:MAG: PaREP1 family protein [Chloroflexota bacterium]|nr:PaREP1 family protein [Chloroflexota bacterium]